MVGVLNIETEWKEEGREEKREGGKEERERGREGGERKRGRERRREGKREGGRKRGKEREEGREREKMKGERMNSILDDFRKSSFTHYKILSEQVCKVPSNSKMLCFCTL